MPRDLLRVALLAELADQRRRASCSSRSRHQIERGRAARRVHPHVERAFPGEREPAVGVIELRRRDAEVEQEAIDAGDRRDGEDLAESRRSSPCTSARGHRRREPRPAARGRPGRDRSRSDARLARVEDRARNGRAPPERTVAHKSRHLAGLGTRAPPRRGPTRARSPPRRGVRTTQAPQVCRNLADDSQLGVQLDVRKCTHVSLTIRMASRRLHRFADQG